VSSHDRARIENSSCVSESSAKKRMCSLTASFFCRTNAIGDPAGASPAASGVMRYRLAIGRIS
jgi:hypothetical protein